MKVSCALFGLLALLAFVNTSPIVKREAEDISPLNEVYVLETDDDPAVDGDDRGDRDKRKIGIVKLAATNGIINFVFGKLDSFLDAKTKALTVLDESNRAKNAAFGIDNTHSATGHFISNLVSQKIQAASGSIGPVINSATTFLAGAKNGLTGAFVSKLAPLSSLSGGVTAGLANAQHTGAGVSAGASIGAGHSGGGSASVGAGVNPAGLLGGLLSSKLGSLSSLSQSGGAGAGIGASVGTGTSGSGASSSTGAGAGINLGAFANLGGGETVATTTEDIPEFDRTRVSLEVPPQAFGTGFTLVTNVSKVLSNVILNSARRTQTVLEVFKPFFRGAFAIKGLPSDDPQ